MKYKTLGKSGLRVSELCLGTMTFGEKYPHMAASREDAWKIFDIFLDAGGNFIDTANLYMGGESEKWVGEMVKPHREKMVLATKYTLSTDPKNANASGNHRKNMVQAVEASLKRLDTDFIDLLWLHAWDSITPVEEVMRAFDDLVRSGKVLYIGISDVPAWVVSRANTMAELRGWSQFIGLQIEYSLVQRAPERDLIPMAAAMGITVTPWSPLGGGMLSGKYNNKETGKQRFGPGSQTAHRFLTDRNMIIAAKVLEIAEKTGFSPAQIALNWVLTREKLAGMIPIIGATRTDQMADNLKCIDIKLDADFLIELDEVSKIDLGFPHDFLNTPMVRSILYGDFHPHFNQK